MKRAFTDEERRRDPMKQKCRRCAADFLPVRDEMRCPQCAAEVAALMAADARRRAPRFSVAKDTTRSAA